MTKLLFSGYYGFDNSGDDAILEAILKDVRADEKFDITVMSNNPKKTSRHYKVKAVDRFYLKDVFGSIKNCDILISGGGSLLQDVTSTRSLYYYLGLIVLAKFFKKKVYLLANGIGPIQSSLNRWLTARVLNRVDMITLRDQMSYDFIQEIGVHRPKIKVTADPVYKLNPIQGAQRQDLFDHLDLDPDLGYIGLALRDWPQPHDLKDRFQDLMTSLLDRGHNLLLLPLFYPNDADYFKELMEGLDPDQLSRVKLIDEKISVAQMLACVDCLKAFIPMRLHGLIYGISRTIPTVPISYDPKVDGLAKDLDMKACFHIDDFKVEDVVREVEGVIDNQEVVDFLQEKKKILQEKTDENRQILEELLEE